MPLLGNRCTPPRPRPLLLAALLCLSVRRCEWVARGTGALATPAQRRASGVATAARCYHDDETHHQDVRCSMRNQCGLHFTRTLWTQPAHSYPLAGLISSYNFNLQLSLRAARYGGSFASDVFQVGSELSIGAVSRVGCVLGVFAGRLAPRCGAGIRIACWARPRVDGRVRDHYHRCRVRCSLRGPARGRSSV